MSPTTDLKNFYVENSLSRVIDSYKEHKFLAYLQLILMGMTQNHLLFDGIRKKRPKDTLEMLAKYKLSYHELWKRFKEATAVQKDDVKIYLQLLAHSLLMDHKENITNAIEIYSHKIQYHEDRQAFDGSLLRENQWYEEIIPQHQIEVTTENIDAIYQYELKKCYQENLMIGTHSREDPPELQGNIAAYFGSYDTVMKRISGKLGLTPTNLPILAKRSEYYEKQKLGSVEKFYQDYYQMA